MIRASLRPTAAVAACLIAGAATARVPHRDLEEAKRTVERIYRDLPRDRPPPVPYAPKLGQLIARDHAYSRASGDVGAIDWDPLCGCQDFAGNFGLVRITAAPRGMMGAKVWVTLRNGGLQNFALDMVLAGGVWRVADVHEADVPSLLALLRREVPREEAGLRRRRMRS